mmetsp:Transcript_17008/g.40574  ORF Transcript_17008/g.40574 Transcript_17008/m.40574 type:complete len:114 (+) Transcript_17008:133-474(+)
MRSFPSGASSISVPCACMKMFGEAQDFQLGLRHHSRYTAIVRVCWAAPATIATLQSTSLHSQSGHALTTQRPAHECGWQSSSSRANAAGSQQALTHRSDPAAACSPASAPVGS